MILVNNDNIEDNKEKIEELETKEKEAIENLEFEVWSTFDCILYIIYR